MSDVTALGILATVISAVGGAGAWLLRTLLSDVLATNRALRTILGDMGRRQEEIAEYTRLQCDMLEDIHREVVGERRTSDYEIAREEIRRRWSTRRDNTGEKGS